MTMTAEQLAQLRADIERRNTLPAFGPDTSIERIKIINDTQRSFTPEVVEALLDELERKDKRIAELESNQTTETGQQIIIEAIGAHGYIVGCLLQGRQDLALEESRKWVEAFGLAALTVEG